MLKKINFLLFFLCSNIAFAQNPKSTDTSYIKINSITVVGNKHTKSFIIERELPFAVGDSLLKKDLPQIFKQAAIQVYNINLFIETNLDSLVTLSNTLDVFVRVKERWYIYPSPQFSLIDRSFNEWYTTYKADFKRVVYGLDFPHDNFRGRRDELNVTVLTGYARNLSFGYSNPYSNAKLTEGYSVFASYTENKELGYKTNSVDKILPFKNGLFVRKSFNAGGSYSRRRSTFKRDGISLDFNYLKVNDSIVTSVYNPNYFNDTKSSQSFLDISYGLSYANTNKNNYPTKGVIYNYGITKRGFGFSGGVNTLILNGSYSKYFVHKHNFFSAVKFAGILKLPFEQAYINKRAIGFGNLNLRGLELYIIDGVAAATVNYTFSKKLFYVKIPVPFNIKVLPYIPFTVYAKTYADAGYSYMPQNYSNRLNNKFLRTAGIGIDVLSIYDIVFKVNYSFNQLGEKRLFLQ
jgi:outer membrane protein assembly factor BamA